MDLSRRTLVKTAVAGTVLTAGCGDGDPDETEPGDDPGESETTGDENPGADETDTPEEETEPGEGTETTGDGETAATVQVGSNPDIGEILVGPEGMTLYMFDEDSQGDGQSACGDDCAGNWPPLTVEEGEPEAGEGVTAELSTFERDDGTMQVAANGWPLYHFAEDEEPGDANGQGANDVWWVLGPDGSPILSNGGGTGTETGTGTSTGDGTPTESP